MRGLLVCALSLPPLRATRIEHVHVINSCHLDIGFADSSAGIVNEYFERHLPMAAAVGGLDAAEILSRTRGSALWGLFYSAFVIAVSIHAAIGVRVIAFEWFGVKRRVWLEALTWSVWLSLLLTGGRAVVAVVVS